MSHTKTFFQRMAALLMGLVLTLFSFSGLTHEGLGFTADAAATNWKFDLGANAESGYTSVSASTGYSSGTGYGFANTSGVKDVSAPGSGALSDAVQFTDVSNADNTFNVDLPNGLYNVTVTLGSCNRTSVHIEHMLQIVNMTGGNAVHTLQVPVTDGQLNIRATDGKSGYPHTISAIEISQASADPTLPNTVWMCGDSTVCNYYPLESSAQAGWGQVLSQYLPSGWNVQNMAASGQYAKGFVDAGQFDVIEKNGKQGDVFIVSIGINDTNYSNADEYYATVTDMVTRAKAKGLVVILVKQQGRCSDLNREKLLSGRWFGGTLDTIGTEQNVQVIDLFNLFQDYCLANGGYDSTLSLYCEGDDLHPNRQGALKLAELASAQIAWDTIKVTGENPATSTGAVIDTSLTYMIRNLNSGLYMTVEGDAPTDGSNVSQQSSKKMNENQLWTFKEAEGGYYYIYSKLEGGERYLLDLAGGNIAAGTNIGIWGDTNNDAQLFRLKENEDGSYLITTKNTSNGSCVEVKDALTTEGGNIQQWGINGHACQSWVLERVTLAEESDTVLGDVNKDGRINVFDLTLMKQHLREAHLDRRGRRNADTNADGSVGIADAVSMQKYLMNGNEFEAKRDKKSVYYAIDQSYNRGLYEDYNKGYKDEAYVNLDNTIGSFIDWVVTVPESGNYLCTFNTANGGANNRQMKIEVNGADDYWVQDFLTTGGWTEWTERAIVLPLNAGRNVIHMSSFTADGGPNMDYLRVELTDEPIAETYVPPVAEEPEETKPVVYIAGDSTVQTYRASYAPQQGWGAFLADYLTEDVTIANHAIAGRSSKSFYDNGRLDTILNTIKEKI